MKKPTQQKTRSRPGRRSSSTAHQEQQRTHILSHAARLFVDLGYASTTMDMLAAAADMNKASLYYYFKNKQEILFSLLKDSAEELLDISSPALGMAPHDALIHLVEQGLKNLYVHRNENRIFLQEIPYLTDTLSRSQFNEIRQMQRRYMKIIYTVIAQGMESGEFRQGDVRLFGQMFASWTSAPIRFLDSVDYREMVETVTQLFLSGLRRTEAVATRPRLIRGKPALDQKGAAQL